MGNESSLWHAPLSILRAQMVFMILLIKAFTKNFGGAEKSKIYLGNNGHPNTQTGEQRDGHGLID